MRKLFYVLLALPLLMAACNKAENPSNNGEEPKYVMEMEMAAAMRLSSIEVDLPDNAFALVFMDDAENTALKILIIGEEGETILKAGEYNIEDSLLEIIATEEEYEFDEGVAVVEFADDIYSFDIVLTNQNGDYHFTYEGVVINMSEDEPVPPGDVEFVLEASFFGGEYYAPTGEITTHNYFFVLSDVVVEGTTAKYPANYFYFDLYSDESNETNTIPNGTYVFDPANTLAAGTCSEAYSIAYSTDEVGDLEWHIFTEGTITVTDGKVVANMVREDGLKMTISYEGDLSLPEADNSDDSLSTLEGDFEFEFNNYKYVVQYYGDYYTDDTDNWNIFIYEDIENLNGNYFLLDLLADPSQIDFAGTYEVLSNTDDYINTFIAGHVDNEGYMAGCWYAKLENGALGVPFAPIVEGSVTISIENDDTIVIAYDCIDDAGYKIQGTVRADIYDDAAAAALAAQPMSSNDIKVGLNKKSLLLRR
jgi:hypothetical protein